MASKILVNKKTGKEFKTSDAESVLKKYPNTFRVKPDTKLAKEIEVKEAVIINGTKDDKPKKKKNTTSSPKKD